MRLGFIDSLDRMSATMLSLPYMYTVSRFISSFAIAMLILQAMEVEVMPGMTSVPNCKYCLVITMYDYFFLPSDDPGTNSYQNINMHFLSTHIP